MNSSRRVSLALLAAALGAGIACGTADSVGPPDKIPCNTLYYGAGELPPPPNGATLCAPGVCNYQSQEGCAAGETCAPHVDETAGTVSPTCRPAGERARGEACVSTSLKTAEQCGRGLQCADGTCHRLCCGADWSACDPGESCIRQAEVKIGKEISAAGADLCFPVGTCNVLDRTACQAEGRNCRIADPVAHVACMPKSELGLGDACDEGHQCGPVLTCVKSGDGEASAVCRRLCPWGICTDDTCAGQGLCVRFNRDPPGVGECTPNWHGDPILIDGGVVVDAAGFFESVGGESR